MPSLEKHFINTQNTEQLTARLNNSEYRCKIDAGHFDIIQLEQITFQNVYSNISFGGDLSYYLGAVYTSFVLPAKYYSVTDLLDALSLQGFTGNYDSTQKRFNSISRSAAWRPAGKCWQAQLGIVPANANALSHAGFAPVQLDFGCFYMSIGGLIGDQGYSLQIPVLGGYGDQVVLVKNEGMFSLPSGTNNLIEFYFRIHDKWGYPVRTQFDSSYVVLWQIQLQTTSA